MPGRSVIDVVLTHRRTVHGEAVVVLAGDDEILHAGILRHLHPGVCVELDGVELFSELGVLDGGDLGAVHDPLADAGDWLAFPFAGGNRVEAPVDEEAEFSLAKPLHFGALRSRRRGGRLRHRPGSADASGANRYRKSMGKSGFHVCTSSIIYWRTTGGGFQSALGTRPTGFGERKCHGKMTLAYWLGSPHGSYVGSGSGTWGCV